MKIHILTLAATTLLATAVQAAPQACFNTRDMRNHTVVDRQTIYVAVGRRDVFRIGADPNCFSRNAASEHLVIETTASTGRVCRPLDLDLGVADNGAGGFTRQCIVRSVEKLTPAQVAAIPKKLRP